MNSNSILGSSLTFGIKNGKDIRGILQLIQTEAQKENCSESEITLISTAISELCRRFIGYSGSLELTFTILTRSDGIELQGKVYVQVANRDTDWNTILQSLNTYFSDTIIQEHDNPASLIYRFQKIIPRAKATYPKLRSGPLPDNSSDASSS